MKFENRIKNKAERKKVNYRKGFEVDPKILQIWEKIQKIYFVAETKSEGQELLNSEKRKVKCGKEHFKVFSEVVYKQVSKVTELTQK